MICGKESPHTIASGAAPMRCRIEGKMDNLREVIGLIVIAVGTYGVIEDGIGRLSRYLRTATRGESRNVDVVGVVYSGLASRFPATDFHVNPGHDGVVYILWVGAPRSAPVQTFLRSPVDKRVIPHVGFSLHHTDEPTDEEFAGAANDGSESGPQQPDNARKAACAVLGIRDGAAPEEIMRAYHHMAQMYHPDKVAGAAPEVRARAEKRMKEINAAYEELRRK